MTLKKYKLVNTQYYYAHSKQEALDIMFESINDFDNKYQFKVVKVIQLSKSELKQEDEWDKMEGKTS